MLYLYRRIAFGEQKNADAAAMGDLDGREIWLLAPIAAVVLWMGVYPESFLSPIRRDVATIVERVERATPKGDSQIVAKDKTTAKYRVKHESGGTEKKAGEAAH
jgi:NADH-quinone oxidoreductase subunit M